MLNSRSNQWLAVDVHIRDRWGSNEEYFMFSSRSLHVERL